MRTIKVFDTTLRDGEQSPGCSMNLPEKLDMARQLEALDRTVTEMELRYTLGQISALQLSEVKTGRTALESGLETLRMNVKSYKLQLEMLIGAEQTGEIALSPLPEVTAEQLAQMAYTDSTLGEIGWMLTEESLAELNRVLREYGILTEEAISQFLAQAAVETAAGKWLVELGDEAYFNKYGYTTGTRGAGFFHLTFEYGQMAFATWMMKRYVPGMEDIAYINPTNHEREEIRAGYYAALRLAANLGLDISAYSRIVYDAQSPVPTGADYLAQAFAWESAGYYWYITGIGEAISEEPGTANTDIVSELVGGGNWQSRREAYAAFYPIFSAFPE